MVDSFTEKTGAGEPIETHISFHVYRVDMHPGMCSPGWYGEGIWRRGRNRGKCGPIGPFDTYGEAMEAAREIYEFDMKGWETDAKVD